MTHFLLTVLRFSLCAWIGAAALFVVTGVREVTSDLFDPATKNELAALRFPAFYLFGFTLLGTATITSGCLSLKPSASRKRFAVILALSAAMLVTMAVDYRWIFEPLAALMSQPDARSHPDFARYHSLSKWINFASLTVCMVTALISLGESRPGNGQSESQ